MGSDTYLNPRHRTGAQQSPGNRELAVDRGQEEVTAKGMLRGLVSRVRRGHLALAATHLMLAKQRSPRQGRKPVASRLSSQVRCLLPKDSRD